MDPLSQGTGYSGKSSGFLDALTGTATKLANAAGSVATAVNAFKKGDASPQAQQTQAAEVQQTQAAKLADKTSGRIFGMPKPVFYGVLVVLTLGFGWLIVGRRGGAK